MTPARPRRFHLECDLRVWGLGVNVGHSKVDGTGVSFSIGPFLVQLFTRPVA